jgi:phosphoesterase RecJ-like protein
VRVVDPAAAATVVLVADLLDGLGVALDAELATCLYAGLAADTGSFRFSNTAPGTHLLAARLLGTGIDHAAISQRLFDTAPFGWLGLLSAAAGRATLEADVGAGLVWTWATVAEARRFLGSTTPRTSTGASR